VNRTDPFEIARAITGLNVWEKAARHNWALVSQLSEEPYVVYAQQEKGEGPVAGRLALFPGFGEFSRFLLTHQAPDFGVAMSPLDFRHEEVVGLKNGQADVFCYEPGFVPQRPDAARAPILAALLYECYGVLMRLEEEPDLPIRYMSEKAMFARKELVENVWRDGPIAVPQPNLQCVEKISVARAAAEKAAALPILPKEVWEIDFVMMSGFHTAEAKPRFLYLLAAVDADTGERRVWEKMSVDGREGGLQRLWEGHAERLLNRFIQVGHVPGALHVRSPRVMRFLRPLAMHVPFKMVQHAKLPALESVIEVAARTNRV